MVRNLKFLFVFLLSLTLVTAAPANSARADILENFATDFDKLTTGIGSLFGGSSSTTSSNTSTTGAYTPTSYNYGYDFYTNGGFSGYGSNAAYGGYVYDPSTGYVYAPSGSSFFTDSGGGFFDSLSQGTLNVGGLIGTVTDVPILGDLLSPTGSVSVFPGTANLDIFDIGAGVLEGVIRGDSVGDAAGDVFRDFASGIITDSPALNDALRGALRGDSIKDALLGAGSGFFRNFSTGSPTLDRLVRAAAGKVGGTLGKLFGLFGLSEQCGGRGLGSVICNLVFSNQLVPFLFSGLAYLFGLYLAIKGIWSLKEHVESPTQVKIWEPMKKFLAGGAFFALPIVLEAVYETVAFGLPGIYGSDYVGAGAIGGGLDTMLVALMSDIWTPMMMAFSAFCYLAGILLVMIAISRILKSEQDGAKGPTGIGTIMTFIVAGALLSVDKMISAVSFSLFGLEVGRNQGALVYTAGMNLQEAAHADAVINAVTAFVAIIGWISFIRGLFMIRSVAEGGQQASSMAAITHIIGGAIAINLGPMLQAVQYTLGIEQIGIAFG